MIRCCRWTAVAVAVLPAVGLGQSSSTQLPGPAAPAGVTAFVDVNVVPMDTERVLPKQTVIIKGGRITALGPATQVKVPVGAVRIDGQGKYLIPGLADMHVHLGLLGSKGEMQLAADSMAERRLFLLLAQGVTTIRNLDYMDRNGHSTFKNAHSPFVLDGPTALRLRTGAAAGQLLAPRIYTAGQWAPEQYLVRSRGEPTPKLRLDSVPAYVAAYKAAGYDFLKVRQEAPEVFDSVIAAARRVGIPVVGHVPDSVPLERALAGMRSIEHLTPYAEYVGGYRPKPNIEELVAATRRANVWNCPTLIQAWRPGAVVKALQEAGAGLLLGTDYPVGVDDAVGLHIELGLLVRAGLTPYQALATGTRNVAQYFGTLDSTGTIAVGKRADLLLLYGNPLDDISHTRPAAGVMLGGRWLERAELDQRLAGPPTERKEYYRQYTSTAYESYLYGSLKQRLANDSAGRHALTAVQRGVAKAHEAQREPLFDSLLSVESVKADMPLVTIQQRLLESVARQLGDLRGELTSAQQIVFDSLARRWQQRYAIQGYRVAIPGVKP